MLDREITTLQTTGSVSVRGYTVAELIAICDPLGIPLDKAFLDGKDTELVAKRRDRRNTDGN